MTTSDVGLVNMSGRPTGVGGKESEWKLSQHPVREIYWSWREGVKSGDRPNSLSGRPTGAGGKESEWRLSQQPVRETYWSWREGVRVETVSTACPGDLLELEGRSSSGDCLNKLNRSMELEGGTPEFKLMQMNERRQRWINAVNDGSTP